MGIFILKKNEYMVQGFPVNRSYTKSETDALISNNSFSKETPTGTINGSNTVFTVTNNPKAVVIDNLMYFGSPDYTVTGSGPYTITTSDMRPPTNSIISIY